MNLTVTPKPMIDERESLIGYILRLAVKNGFTSLKDMVDNRFIIAAVKNDTAKVQKVLPLTPLFYISPDIAVTSSLWKQPRLLEPKVCIHCLNERHLIKDEHLSASQHVCSIHKELLISECRACQVPLRWELNLLNAQCTNPYCCRQLTSSNVKTLLNLTPSQVMDSLSASQFVNGTLSTFTKSKIFVDSANYQRDIKMGYDFLSSSASVKAWAQDQFFRTSEALPVNLRNSACTLLRASLNESWQSIVNLGLLAKVEKSDNPFCDDKANYPLFINRRIACKLLGVSFDDLILMHKEELLHTLTHNRLTVASIVNVLPLFDFLVKKSSPTLNNAKRLNSFTKLMSDFLVTTRDVIKGFKNSQLEFRYSAQETYLSSIEVNGTKFEAFCKATLVTKQDDLITLQQASAIIKIPKMKLVAARKKGLLPSPRGYQSDVSNLCYCRDALALRKIITSSQMNLDF
jgi:hypothetical protein